MYDPQFRFPFGKYGGKTLDEIYRKDKGYLDWAVSPRGLSDKPDLVSKIRTYLTQRENGTISHVEETVTVKSGNSPSETRDYGIKYGDFINFPDEIIRRVLDGLNIAYASMKHVFTVIKGESANLNSRLFERSKKYFEDPSNLEGWEEGDLGKDLVKIYFAWYFGVLGIPMKTTITRADAALFQGEILKKWENGSIMKDIIYDLTLEAGTWRKQCKKVPYMFTPAMCQFLMLGLNGDDMNKLHKCNYDRVMWNEKEDFPRKRERVSVLYDVDWARDYYAFVMNPYAYYNIPLSTCDNVIITSKRNTDNFLYERGLGEFSRYVYSNSKDNRWSATPDWLITKEFPDIINSKELLIANYGIFFDMEHVYLRHIYYEEQAVAAFVTGNLTLQTGDVKEKYIPKELDGFALTAEQVDALRGSLSKALSVITGLAGTGKTTVIKGIARYLRNSNKTFIICAFTAKAKRRIIEVLGDDFRDPVYSHESRSCVRTIHSTISHFTKIEDPRSGNNLGYPDYLIIDEATTVSLSLLSKLLKFITDKGVNVIMTGDINQLTPIKYGRCFEDIVNSGHVDIYRLTQILRVQGGVTDPIITNSTNIVVSPGYTPFSANNFQVITCGDLQRVACDLVSRYKITLDNIQHHKFVTATNDDNTELNRVLSSCINPHESKYRNISCLTKRKDSLGNKVKVLLKYSLNDPVIFTKNDVYPGVSNGSEGVITGFTFDIATKSECMIVTVDSDGSTQNINVPLHQVKGTNDKYTARHIFLAYSITVYKAQGSEWSNVYFYVNGYASKRFLNKRCSYTAITRAKKNCCIVESRQHLYTSVCRTPINVHYGRLCERIALGDKTRSSRDLSINTTPLDSITSMMSHVRPFSANTTPLDSITSMMSHVRPFSANITPLDSITSMMSHVRPFSANTTSQLDPTPPPVYH